MFSSCSTNHRSCIRYFIKLVQSNVHIRDSFLFPWKEKDLAGRRRSSVLRRLLALNPSEARGTVVHVENLFPISTLTFMSTGRVGENIPHK